MASDISTGGDMLRKAGQDDLRYLRDQQRVLELLDRHLCADERELLAAMLGLNEAA